MIELLLALFLQLLNPSSDASATHQKKSDTSTATTQSVSTQSTTPASGSTLQYDGGQTNWDTRD